MDGELVVGWATITAPATSRHADGEAEKLIA